MRAILAKVAALAKHIVRVEDFHRQRGAIIALWAVVEMGIDRANATAWEFSDRTISKVVPINLRWKLETFDRIHRQLIPFESLRKQAEHIIAEVRKLQNDRHWLAHGALDVAASNTTEGWRLTKGTSQADGSMDFISRRFTSADLSAINTSTQRLSLRLARYSATLAFQLNKHSADDQRS